jgi:hypothetical protein
MIGSVGSAAGTVLQGPPAREEMPQKIPRCQARESPVFLKEARIALLHQAKIYLLVRDAFSRSQEGSGLSRDDSSE